MLQRDTKREKNSTRIPHTVFAPQLSAVTAYYARVMQALHCEQLYFIL